MAQAPIDHGEIRKALLARQKELNGASVADTSAAVTAGMERGNGGLSGIRTQVPSPAAERQRQAERRRVDAALARLDQGEWGFCVSCGEAIAEGRLRKDPSVPSCLRCAGG